VGHTLFLLTASLIAGQNAGTEVITVPQPLPRTATLGEPIATNERPIAQRAASEIITVPQSSSHTATLGEPTNADRPNLWERMRSWKPFARNDEGTPSDRPRLFQRMQMRLGERFQRNPDTGTPAPAAVKPASPARSSEPPLADTNAKTTANVLVAPITFHASSASRPLSPKVAEKTGHDTNYTWITGQLRKANGRWIIHYSNPEVVDRFGGSLILDAPAGQMGSFHDGDLVSAQGRVIRNGYQATSVNLIEHETN
jgi:hypothetical protein